MGWPGTSVAMVAAMTRTRIYVLCVFLATLPGTGCAGRQGVSSVPTVSPNSKSDRADAGATSEMRKAIGALRESLREKKPAPPAQPPQRSVSASPADQRSDEQGVGTSGKWVVTTATQRPNESSASTATRTVKPPDARPRDGMTLQVVGPLLIAGLLLILAAVAAARRRVPERH
jgi:hypothetical protein